MAWQYLLQVVVRTAVYILSHTVTQCVLGVNPVFAESTSYEASV
jgi:hypothetical protein